MKFSGLLAQTNHVCLAEDKGRLFIRDDGRGFAREANVFGANMLE
jgi:signal transduction histidine kinase